MKQRLFLACFGFFSFVVCSLGRELSLANEHIEVVVDSSKGRVMHLFAATACGADHVSGIQDSWNMVFRIKRSQLAHGG